MPFILATLPENPMKIFDLCSGFGVSTVFSYVDIKDADQTHHTFKYVPWLSDLDNARKFVHLQKGWHSCIVLPLHVMESLVTYFEKDFPSKADFALLREGSVVIYKNEYRIIVQFENQGYSMVADAKLDDIEGLRFYDMCHADADIMGGRSILPPKDYLA